MPRERERCWHIALPFNFLNIVFFFTGSCGSTPGSVEAIAIEGSYDAVLLLSSTPEICFFSSLRTLGSARIACPVSLA